LTPFTNASVAPQISLVQLLKQQFIRGITANTATLHKDNSSRSLQPLLLQILLQNCRWGLQIFLSAMRRIERIENEAR